MTDKISKYLFLFILFLIVSIISAQAGIKQGKKLQALTEREKFFKAQWDNCLLTLEKEMIESNKCKIGVN